jgi:hypothetical protein
MTGTAVAMLPTDGDSNHWSDQERALVEAAGLVRVTNKQTGEKALADRATVEAFLAHCRRTALDPIARQIYAIYRAGKWGIQISIDGARLVAERTGQYEGQTTPEFTADGTNWTQVWLSDEQPKAARVGVYRRGFREPLYAIALWDAYAVYQDEWENGHKTGRQTLSAMWKKMGPLMLAKCFDTETEVLTDRGFMLFADVTTERIMQVTDHGIEPVKATPFAQAYSGPMISNHGDMLDFAVTPNHDMVTTVGKVEAGAMLATSNYRSAWRIPLTVPGQREDNALVNDGDLRLAAAIVADGNAAGADAFRVAVSRPAKVTALRGMQPESEHVEHSAGASVVTKTRTIRTNFDKDVFRFSADRVRAFIDMSKTINLDAMVALSPRQMRVFMDAWVEFDGSVNQKSGVRRLYTSRADHLRAAELLAVGAGYSVNVARERTSDISTRPNFVLTISEPNAQPVNLPLGDRPGIAQEPTNESGVVWCVTVPSGQIVVRRRGFSMVVGNCAEMLALRKAFPQDLSGLYSTEEMDQAGGPREVVKQAEQPAQSAPLEVQAMIATPTESRDWVKAAAESSTFDELTVIANDAQTAGELGLKVADGRTVMDVLHARRRELTEPVQEPLVDVPAQRPVKRQWVREARSKQSRGEVRELIQEAIAAGVLAQIVEELEAIEGTLSDPSDVEPEEEVSWPVAEIPQSTGEWADGESADEEPF